MRTAVVVLAAIFSAACSGKSRIVLPRFDADVAPPQVASLAGAPAAVHVVGFSVPSGAADQDATRIGMARTGISKRFAVVRVTEPPAELVTRTLEEALSRAGMPSATAESADYSVGGTIERFSVEERHGVDMLQTSVAIVRFEAVVTDLRTDEPRAVLSREYSSEAASYPSIDATKAQKYMVKQAVDDSIQSLLDDADLWRALGMAIVAPAPRPPKTSTR